MIAVLTEEIKTDTKNVEQAIGNSLLSVMEGVQIIRKAGTSFTSISQAINTITMQIEDVSATAEQLSAGAQRLHEEISSFNV